MRTSYVTFRKSPCAPHFYQYLLVNFAFYMRKIPVRDTSEQGRKGVLVKKEVLSLAVVI